MTATQIAVEVAGWTGALLSPAYQWMNIVGAGGFVINGWWHRAIPSTALNVVWMGIGAVALWKVAQRRGSST